MSSDEIKIIRTEELEKILQQHNTSCEYARKVEGTQGLMECTQAFLKCPYQTLYDKMAYCLKESWKKGGADLK